jgi:Cys-rich repeat protein
MSESGFDQLSRMLAQPKSRRTALKAIGASVGATVSAVVLKPFRAGAIPACPTGSTACGPHCCSSGTVCLDQSTGRCSCAAGYSACGSGCCMGTCVDPANSCCCDKGTTPCGAACCQKGVACYDASSSLCGCPAGTTPCSQSGVLTCAPKGQTCAGGPWPPPNTQTKSCAGCKTFNTACASGSECCSGVCSVAKGGFCGCASDSDCPSGFVCDPKQAKCVD